MAAARQVGVTNGVLRCAGMLTKLQSLHMPDAFRVTDAGLRHLSTLTGATSFSRHLALSVETPPPSILPQA